MELIETGLDGAVCIVPKVFQDDRGFFLESYNADRLREQGITADFVQDNHSLSRTKGVLRGLHFQEPPFAQAKLVRVVRGAVLDVIVDIRKNSPTFGKWKSVELTQENFMMLYVPRGFAHGFCTLRENTEFLYKVDNYYHPEHDRGIRYDDPDLSIPWPVSPPVVSANDAQLPHFRDISSPF